MPARRTCVVASSVATVGDGWSRSGVIGGGGSIGCGVHGKHVLQCGDPDVGPVEANEVSRLHKHRFRIVPMFHQ